MCHRLSVINTLNGDIFFFPLVYELFTAAFLWVVLDTASADTLAWSMPALVTHTVDTCTHSHAHIHINNVPPNELQADLEAIHLYPSNVWLGAQ